MSRTCFSFNVRNICLFALLVSINFLTNGIQVEAQEPVVETQRWEFGLEISSTGNATGIIASVPIPIEWPEQSIELVEEKQEGPVTRLSFDEVGTDGKLLLIKINKMSGNEIVRASVVIDIKKSNIVAPASPDDFRFATKRETSKLGKFLKPSPYIECNDRRIKEIADLISFDDEISDYEKVHRIYDWVRDNIEYEFDKTIRTCVEALDRKKGDCEELSSLFIAICRAKNIPARAVWIPDHTYPEFYLIDKDGVGTWLPCQAAGEYEFGSMTETKPILQKGDNFKIPGHPENLRYLQPTLKARDASGSLSLQKWIMQKIETGEESSASDK